MLPRLALLALAALLAAAPAAAQPAAPNHTARPAAGTLSARPGAVAAQDLTVRTGQPNPIAYCAGDVQPSAPDVVVDWRGGGPLRLTTRAARDLTLLVRLPDGSWRCDDDTDSLHPVVEIADAPRGRYAVWVGSFGLLAQDVPVSATLYAGLPPPALVATGRPVAGEVRLASGFEAQSGAQTFANVRVGGPDLAEPLGADDFASCAAFIDAAQPTLRIAYTATGGVFYVHAASEDDADLTMLVLDPEGTVFCMDDEIGSDPVFFDDEPITGTYAVWVGTFVGQSRSDIRRARLTVSETPPEGFSVGFGEGEGFADFGAIPFSEGTYRPLDVNAAPRHRLALGTDDDAVRLSAEVTATVPNPVQGDACRASLDALPVADIDVAPGERLSIYASADLDGVMLVRTPSGRWFCSDDADGLDPGIEFEAPEAGTYRVWLGAFITDTPATFALVADRNPLTVSGTEFDFGAERPFFGTATYTGTVLRTAEPETTFVQGARSYSVTTDLTSASDLANPAEGFGCAGYVGARPQVALERTGGGPLVLIARADGTDLVLLVRAPDGQWYCSDDAEGTNPAVQLSDAPDGTYTVWVGTFSPSSVRQAATLEARRGQLDD